MRCFLLQDYVTIRGSSAVTSIKQADTGWVDLSAFQDAVFWLEVKELVASASFTMNYETSPTLDDSTFVSLASFVLATGVTVTTVLKDVAATPIAKYVRWRLANNSGALWDATFRIWVAANAVGKAASEPHRTVAATQRFGERTWSVTTQAGASEASGSRVGLASGSLAQRFVPSVPLTPSTGESPKKRLP